MNTVRLKPETQEKLRSLAKKRGVSVSDIHRKAIETYLAQQGEMETVQPGGINLKKSRWDKFIGVVEGSKDDSVNVSQYFSEYVNKKHSHDSD